MLESWEWLRSRNLLIQEIYREYKYFFSGEGLDIELIAKYPFFLNSKYDNFSRVPLNLETSKNE